MEENNYKGMPETFGEGENGLGHTDACVSTMLMFASVHLELVAYTACKIPLKSLFEKYDGKSQKIVLDSQKPPGMTALWMETGHLSGGWVSCIAGTGRDTQSSKAYSGQKLLIIFVLTSILQ